MSEENVEAVRRNFDAFNRGDLNAFVDRFTPDATVHPLEFWPDSLIRRGREEILRLMTELREPWEKPTSRAVKIVDNGDYVVTEILYRGIMKGSEDEIEWRLGMSLTFREGKVTDMSFFRTFDEALKAAGLSE